MRSFLSLVVALFFCTNLKAQNAELSVIASGGLFHYTGISAAKQSFLSNASYTNDIYGNRNGFSYGGALQLKLISKKGFIAGLQTGYDVLRSKVNLSQPNFQYGYVSASSQVPSNYTDVSGYAILSNTFININPFVGYRVIDKTLTLDILPGIDIGIGLSGHEHNKVTAAPPSTTYTNTIDRGKPATDFRLRIGAEAGYKRVGVSVSYASGKANYLRNFNGISGNPQAYSSYLRFGVSYRIF